MATPPRLVPVPDDKGTFEAASPEQAHRMEACARAMLKQLHGMSYDEGFSAVACVVACLTRDMNMEPNLVEAFTKTTFALSVIEHYRNGTLVPEVTL
jgi:hypothetical protein